MAAAPENPCPILLPEVQDPQGNLCYAQYDTPLPFQPARAYFVREIPADAVRGGHSHRRNREVIFCLQGACTLWLYDRNGREKRFRLEHPARGVYIPTGWWVELGEYAEGSLTLVLASLPYSEKDYIRSPEEFFYAEPYPDTVYRPRR